MIEGMFADWSTKTLADQCHMQAREQLDPEFTQLMTAVGNRLAALDSRAGEDVRPDSWAASPEDIRERAQLLVDVELHLKSSRIFITTRQKMHPCGVELHDELLGRVTAAIESIGKVKGHD